ncbi:MULTISPECIES: hypothetical protein [unclassified Colwellia]|uniref:hypothetical protein n=1 Tax=unclassified Colwellia TaxID=196834 RepID=UPI0015F7764D|nr:MULTISPECIES: hypothetical protein [unclassified Colwellia]MBA6351682.1 hypothetical protein [Colwellia sp. BRX9-1]MBA6358125.1 hypothetical protein [Colwellia sp. BRX8-3]MBA6359071.1 hypothetical protein [Colwellia sp. BRX8-6]MBA6368474.1 hypothetical protein [Colwellia sp. BRX8-5]MBA6376089.1 hypothetical protein [Colwellia sp. BRX8-2]
MTKILVYAFLPCALIAKPKSARANNHSLASSGTSVTARPSAEVLSSPLVQSFLPITVSAPIQ